MARTASLISQQNIDFMDIVYKPNEIIDVMTVCNKATGRTLMTKHNWGPYSSYCNQHVDPFEGTDPQWTFRKNGENYTSTWIDGSANRCKIKFAPGQPSSANGGIDGYAIIARNKSNETQQLVINVHSGEKILKKNYNPTIRTLKNISEGFDVFQTILNDVFKVAGYVVPALNELKIVQKININDTDYGIVNREVFGRPGKVVPNVEGNIKIGFEAGVEANVSAKQLLPVGKVKKFLELFGTYGGDILLGGNVSLSVGNLIMKINYNEHLREPVINCINPNSDTVSWGFDFAETTASATIYGKGIISLSNALIDPLKTKIKDIYDDIPSGTIPKGIFNSKISEWLLNLVGTPLPQVESSVNLKLALSLTKNDNNKYVIKLAVLIRLEIGFKNAYGWYKVDLDNDGDSDDPLLLCFPAASTNTEFYEIFKFEYTFNP